MKSNFNSFIFIVFLMGITVSVFSPVLVFASETNTSVTVEGEEEAEAPPSGGGTFIPPIPPQIILDPSPEHPEIPKSLIINNNSDYTNSLDVVLNLSAQNAFQMAISNFSDFANVSWEDYNPTKNWTLTSDEGNKTVHAKFRSEMGGVSAVVSNSIILDTKPPEIKIIESKNYYSSVENVILVGKTEVNAEVVLCRDKKCGLVYAGELGELVVNLGKMPAGNYQLKLTPADLAGNKGKSLIIGISVEPPVEILEVEPPKPIIEKIPEILEPFIPEILKPKPELKPEPKEELEEIVTIPEEAPIVMWGKWQLLPREPIRKFVLDPLPRGIESLAEKFPDLKETLKKVGVNKITDFDKLQGIKLALPGLAEVSGFSETKTALLKEIKIADLLASAKENIPAEVVFVKTGGELIDVGVGLTVTDKGEIQQKFSTVANGYLTLVVKPESKAESVRGYVIFESGRLGHNRDTGKLGYKDTGYWDIGNYIRSAFAKTFEKDDVHNSAKEIEEKLVLQEFEYTDLDSDGIYTAKIQAPGAEGEYEIITVIEYEDPDLGTRVVKLTTVIDPEGYVYEKIGNQELRIKNATVSLLWLNPQTNEYERWLSEKYQQKNPQITDATGKYSFLVPEGNYYLTAEASGYLAYQSELFEVKEDKGVHINIELKTKYGWLKIIDWKVILLILVTILLAYNFYKDRKRKILNS